MPLSPGAFQTAKGLPISRYSLNLPNCDLFYTKHTNGRISLSPEPGDGFEFTIRIEMLRLSVRISRELRQICKGFCEDHILNRESFCNLMNV